MLVNEEELNRTMAILLDGYNSKAAKNALVKYSELIKRLKHLKEKICP